MNTSSSDFSSGCESGWTQYFVKSRRTGSMKMMCGDYYEVERNSCYGGGGEEEDLSMVSDASSGPRVQNNDEECYSKNQNISSCRYNNASDNKPKKSKSGQHKDKSQLDDTASSHSKGRASRKKYFGS